MVIPPLSDYMYHILVFVFVFVPIFVLIFVFAFVFQTERVPAGAGRTLLVSSLSQFKIKSIFHRSTPTQSHTPMFTKLNPNIYKWMKSCGRFHMPQNGTHPQFTFKRVISKILLYPSFFSVCIVVALPRVGDLTPQIAAGTNTLLPPCHPSYSLGVAACICSVCLNLCPDAFSSAPPKSSNQTSKI